MYTHICVSSTRLYNMCLCPIWQRVGGGVFSTTEKKGHGTCTDRVRGGRGPQLQTPPHDWGEISANPHASTSVSAEKHACTHTYIYVTNINTYTCINTYHHKRDTYIHIHTITKYIHICVHTYHHNIHTHTYTYIHTYVHTYHHNIHSYIHSYHHNIHTYTYTYIHTHRRTCFWRTSGSGSSSTSTTSECCGPTTHTAWARKEISSLPLNRVCSSTMGAGNSGTYHPSVQIPNPRFITVHGTYTPCYLMHASKKAGMHIEG